MATLTGPGRGSCRVTLEKLRRNWRPPDREGAQPWAAGGILEAINVTGPPTWRNSMWGADDVRRQLVHSHG
jgi:hypothetical protein